MGPGVGCLACKEHSGPESDFPLWLQQGQVVCDRPMGQGVGRRVEGMG